MPGGGRRGAPALLIDLATLTGAARTALGPELPAAYSPDEALLASAHAAGEATCDPLWPMPLWAGYDDEFNSRIADIGNVSAGPFAGSIVAALFLKRFVTTTRAWLHLDLYAWNPKERPGRPVGRRGPVRAGALQPDSSTLRLRRPWPRNPERSTRAAHDPRRYSRLVVDGAKQAPSRAMLRAVGFRDADFKKPQVGIASTWANLTPCNMHIAELARAAAAGVDAAGGKSVLFNTITVSDGISMGSPGMRYSLVSREVIADSIETVVGAEGFDGFVAVGGCDKNMPGCAMAMARMNRPAAFVYGGTIRPDCSGATSCRCSRRWARMPPGK